MNKKPHLNLSDDEISSLTSLISKGQLPAKVFRRVTALLELSRGRSIAEIARTLSVTKQSVAAWRDRYLAEQFTSVYDKPRSGRPIVISGAGAGQVDRFGLFGCSRRLRPVEFASAR